MRIRSTPSPVNATARPAGVAAIPTIRAPAGSCSATVAWDGPAGYTRRTISTASKAVPATIITAIAIVATFNARIHRSRSPPPLL